MASSGARPLGRVVAAALRGSRSASAVPMRAAPIVASAAAPAPSPDDAAAVQREALRTTVRALVGSRDGAVPTREALRAALPADHPFHARKTLPSWDAIAEALVAASTAEPQSQKGGTQRTAPLAAAVSAPAARSKATKAKAAGATDAGGPRLEPIPLFTPRPLRPYQAAGVEFIVSRRATLLADEMGLGKTVQALAALAAKQAFPAVVVCPAFLKTNWAREAAAWLPGARVQVLDGGATPAQPGFDITVVNYDILPRHVDNLAALPLKALILDESQYIKNPGAQRTEAALKLAAAARHGPDTLLLLLSGTPVLNRPVELLPQLQALGKAGAVAHTTREYLARYCDPKERMVRIRNRLIRVVDTSGASNTAELNEKLTTGGFFLRRLKRDVLSELPPKSRVEVIVSLPPTAKAEYDTAARGVRRAKGDDAKARGMMSALRSKLALLKLPLVLDWIDGFLEAAEPPRKLIVFAHHAALVDGIAEHCAGHLRVRGSDSPAARQEAVDVFQRGGEHGPRVIACNIAAAGVGLTLTAATDVLFAELAWAPMANAQAEDRAHRLGQQSAVTVTTLLAEGTIDMVVSRVVDAKRRVVDSAVDGGARAPPPPPRPPIGGGPAVAVAVPAQPAEDDELAELSVAAEVARELGM